MALIEIDNEIMGDNESALVNFFDTINNLKETHDEIISDLKAQTSEYLDNLDETIDVMEENLQNIIDAATTLEENIYLVYDLFYENDLEVCEEINLF